jgi:ParB/RepB/Spo0J family partition protein
MAKVKNPTAMLGGFARLNALAERVQPVPNASAPLVTNPVIDSTEPQHPEISANTAMAGTSPLPSENDTAGYLRYGPNSSYSVGDRITLPLNKVIENPINPRVFYIDGQMSSLVKSIAQHGLLTPVQVYPADEDGNFMLKSGHRRTRSLKFLNRQFVTVEVVPAQDNALTAYKEARDINVEQRSQTHFDDGVRFTQFLNDGVASGQRQLAESMGIPEAEISKCLSIAGLPTDILQAMAEHVECFGLTSAYTVYRFWSKTEKDSPRTLKLVHRVIEGRMSNRQLESLVKDSVNMPPGKRRDRALSRAEVSGLGAGELKAFEGKLTLDLNNLQDESRDLIFRKIITLFKELGLGVDTAATHLDADDTPN